MKTQRHWPPEYTEEQRIAAFWAKVRKSGGCWEWTATKNWGGYGRFHTNHRLMLAHRYSWLLAGGTIPDGQFLLHRCDNRACVRPDHLFLGTKKDNMVDCVAKGRAARGSKRPNAKLTEADVSAILRLLADGLTCCEVARRFNMSHQNVSDISLGRRWNHVPRPPIAKADNGA